MCPIVNYVLVSLCNIIMLEDSCNLLVADAKLDIWETYVINHLYRSEIVLYLAWTYMDLHFQMN